MNQSRRRLVPRFPVDPNEQVGYLGPSGVVTTGRPSGLLLRHIYGSMLLHRPHDLWVAPPGPDQCLQAAIRDRLRAERFSPDDAEEWASRKWRRHIRTVYGPDHNDDDDWVGGKVVEIALAYRDTGMPIDEAFGWAALSLSAGYAVHNRSRGWNPYDFQTLVALCLRSETDEQEDAWVDSPIPAWRALRYLSAGLSLAEALHHESRGLETRAQEVDAAIDLLLALRNDDL